MARGNRRLYIGLLTFALCLLLAPPPAPAEQLPIKTYTVVDGLAQDNVSRIVRDSLGFLWFCTGEGLSRFDGYQFTSYTTDEGLPHRRVNDFLETREGVYWIATEYGLCRFNPAGGTQLFTISYPGDDDKSRRVRVLLLDRSGAIWCGTDAGLYLMQPAEGQVHFQFVGIRTGPELSGPLVQALVEDRQGTLWIGTGDDGLYRRRPDGRTEHYTSTDSPRAHRPDILNALPSSNIEVMLADHAGRLWAGTPHGLCQIAIDAGSNRPRVVRVYTTRDGLADPTIESLFETADGHLWIGNNGLSELVLSPDGSERLHTFTTLNGLSSYYVNALTDDRDGNLWIGTDSGGVMKLARGGFTTYTEADGLARAGADAIFQDRAGKVCVVSSGGKHFINRFDGQRFTSVCPAFPNRINDYGWGWNQIAFQDRSGEWWVPTGQGLCRFAASEGIGDLGRRPPLEIYTTRDGLPFNEIFRLYEDTHDDIWISTISPQANGLSRWNRATNTIQTFSETDGLVALTERPVSAFAEDAAGNLWIGHLADGGLTRWSAGRFTFFSKTDGLPGGGIRSIYMDHAKRLWIASAVGGLARVDHPDAEHPHFDVYTTSEGLSSNDTWCVTEDQWGRIYAGAGRGVDRLDPDTGHIKHYTTADGLMRGKVTSAFRDSHGALWFGSNVHGLSRLVPEPDSPREPPPILIRGLRLAGVNYPLSQLGERDVQPLNLAPNQNQLSIDFAGIGFDPGEVLRYQYRLEGADKDWSAASTERSVNYGHLAPGAYRFVVRAIDDHGLISERPASVSFTVLPPVWRRWWFIALAAGA
ncbi:MAG TPA: two-component regulator propeller domain-containing protein, partial [Blastocatellia bacterium]